MENIDNSAQLDRIETALASRFAAEAYQEFVAEDRNLKIANAALAFLAAFEQLKSVASEQG
jgi:hypothetical protein